MDIRKCMIRSRTCCNLFKSSLNVVIQPTFLLNHMCDVSLSFSVIHVSTNFFLRSWTSDDVCSTFHHLFLCYSHVIITSLCSHSCHDLFSLFSLVSSSFSVLYQIIRPPLSFVLFILLIFYIKSFDSLVTYYLSYLFSFRYTLTIRHDQSTTRCTTIVKISDHAFSYVYF